MKSSKDIMTSAYELMYEEELKDNNSLGVVLRHKKSGARVCVLSNDDENKVFYIGFRTPPKDSTGVAHIIEHTVLCGSEKYPLKDPFVELIKGSLNTFLNAFTYPDHTMYPLASCNEQDFKNLMSVYMDAVLHPNIYHFEEIFKQEGWHYEIDDDGKLKINGVVYNEMKGAFSNPEQVLFRAIMHSLYPDNSYGVESGGDPEVIPELTYENYLNFHRKFYHPANSYIYLYGNCDMKERLEWLDNAYLSSYDEIEVDSDINLQKAFGEKKEVVDTYPVSNDDSTEGKTYLSYNMTIGTCEDPMLCESIELLNNVLLSPVGILYQALVKSGISPNIDYSYTNDIKQPFLSIIAKDTDEDKKEKFLEVIRDTLQQVVKDGVPERSLRATINSAEFRYREADFGNWPKGLVVGLMVMSGWLFNEKGAFTYLHGNDMYAKLREKIGTGYYEELIEKYFLNPEHATVFIMKPEPGKIAKMEQELEAKLDAYKATLTPEELEGIKAAQQKLSDYQSAPETKENLEKLPLLAREDLNHESPDILTKVTKCAKLNTLAQEVFTNGVAYLNLHFDLHDVPKEKLPYLGLLQTALGYMDTDNYSYRELDNEVNIETGGIFTGMENYIKLDDSEYYRPVFNFTAKYLYDKADKAIELIKEQMFATKLDDKVRMKEIVLEQKSRKQMELMNSGHIVAVNEANCRQHEGTVFTSITSGLDYYNFICDLVDHYDEKADEIGTVLKELCGIIFNKKNLIVEITAEADGIEKTGAALENLAKVLGGETLESDFLVRPANFGLELKKGNTAYTCPGQVQFVAKAGNYMANGLQADGTILVANSILRMNYYWDKVRVHGGAYGFMTNVIQRMGDYLCVSYRDPNLKETLDVIDHAWEYLRDFDADEREMTKFVIGTMSDYDAPLTPRMLGKRSFAMTLAGITKAHLEKEREEILNAGPEQIRGYAELMRKTIENASLCVVGSEAKVEENKDLFDSVGKLV